MNKPSFVYCFTKKLASDTKSYRVSLKIFEDSVKYLSKIYNYKIYSDEDTLNDIKHLGDNIELVNTNNFIFYDDFKVSLLSVLKTNEILIDPDVLVYKKVECDLDTDIIFCHKDLPQEPWYKDYIHILEGSLLYEKLIPLENIPFIPNIGFLKINNSKLLKDYTYYYDLYSKDLLSRPSKSLDGASIFLGQCLLGLLLYEDNYSYFNLRDANTREKYVHLAGPQKFELYK